MVARRQQQREPPSSSSSSSSCSSLKKVQHFAEMPVEGRLTACLLWCFHAAACQLGCSLSVMRNAAGYMATQINKAESGNTVIEAVW